MMLVVAYIGGFTAFMAATVALVKKDIKQTIACSTISRFGYVMSLVVSRPQWATALGRAFPGVYAFLYRAWYFDAFYDRAFVRPAKALGRALREFDQRGLGRFVGGIGGTISWSGERLRVFQTGGAQNYALLIAMSVLVLGLIVGISAGVTVMYLISGAGIVVAAAVALLAYRGRRAQ